MTPEVLKFVAKCPVHEGRFLEVGSWDKKGSVRKVFKHADYLGVDLYEGDNVDVVMDALDLPTGLPDESPFDVVISVETLEHVRDWGAFLEACWGCVRVGGYLVLTACRPGKSYHGYPDDFWRFTEDDMRAVFKEHEVVEVGEVGVSCGAIVRRLSGAGLLTDLSPQEVKRPLKYRPRGRFLYVADGS